MHRKASADAGALAIAERLPGIDRSLGLRLAAEILGVERIRVRPPDVGVAMQGQHMHQDERTFLEPVFSADDLVLERCHAIGRRRRPQPQRLLQDLRDVGELRDLLIGRLDIDVATEHPVDFIVGFLQHLGMFQQRIDRAGQHSAGGLVACDQECVDLVTDVDVVELRAGGAVDAGHHGTEHVLLGLVDLGVLAPFRDDFVHHLVHERDVAGEVTIAVTQPQPLERETAGQHDGLERAHQRRNERMIVLSIERIEPIIEPAQSDGIQRQRGRVVNDVDFIVGVHPLPFFYELLGDIEHAGVIGLHRAIAERRHQDVVRLAPVRFVGMGRKQAVAADGSHTAQRAAHRLVETFLITDLIDQIGARDNDKRRTHHVEPVDRPEFFCQPHHVLDRRGRVQRQYVADHWLGRRMRDRTQSVAGRHCGIVSCHLLRTGLILTSAPLRASRRMAPP